LAQTGMASASGVNLGLVALEAADIQATDEGVQALQGVLEKSTQLCRTVYQESPLDAGNMAMSLTERFGSKQRPLETKQFNVLQALVEWRDQLARRTDESWNFIAPDACLWRICLAVPTTPIRLRNTCNPLPMTLQQHAQEVVDLICQCGEGRKSDVAAEVAQTAALEGPQPTPEPSRPAHVSSEPVMPKPSWPSRPEETPRPLVHITANFGIHGLAGCGMSVLCPFQAESLSDEEAADGSAGAKIQRDKAKAIRQTISFAAPAPVASEVTPAVSSAADAGVPEPIQDILVDTPLQETAKTLRPRKKKRKRQPTAADCLEKVVATEATLPEPADTSIAAEASSRAEATEATLPEPASSRAEDITAPRLKKRKKVVKKVKASQTVVDPYL